MLKKTLSSGKGLGERTFTINDISPSFLLSFFRSGSVTDKEMIARSIHRMHQDIEEQKDKRKALRQMELFVLDNSLRESTVGQLRGHTIENKWKIYEQVMILPH